MTEPTPTVRVSVAQRDAVIHILPIAQVEFARTSDQKVLGETIAAAVVSAEDYSTTRYLIGTRDPNGNTLIYGTFPTHAAAIKVIESGLVGVTQGSQAGVFPLIPIPRPAKRKAAPKAAPKSRGKNAPAET